MSDYQKHLYVIMHPNHALVASQLEPIEFGKQYSVGTKRYYQGKILFAEVDISYRNDFLPIEEYLEKTVAHPDGSPKHTKIIASYRVLEHLDLDAIGDLYCVTVTGQTLKISKADYSGSESQAGSGQVKILQEINPLQLLVATTLDHKSFGAQMTSGNNPKGAPKLFFTQIDFDVESFLEEWEKNPFLHTPIPDVHPQKLASALDYLRTSSDDRTATIGLASVFDKVFYRKLTKGFFLSHGENMNYYPFPSHDELERDHYTWYRSTD